MSDNHCNITASERIKELDELAEETVLTDDEEMEYQTLTLFSRINRLSGAPQ